MVSDPRKRKLGHLWPLLKGLVSIALLVYCLTLIDVPLFLEILSQAELGYLFGALVLVVIEVLIGAYRFKLMLDCDHAMSFRAHAYQYFAATYFNLILPGSIGGDAARVIWLGERSASRRKALILIIMERYFGLLTLVLVAVLAGLITDLPTTIVHFLQLVSVGALFSLVAVFALRGLLSGSGRLITALNKTGIREIQLFKHRGRMVVVFLVSLIYQYATIGISFLVALAFGIAIPLGEIFALVPLVWIATLFPLSLGGLGVREVSFIYLFALVGVSQENALSLSLGTYMVFLCAGLLGGIAFTVVQNRRGV